MKKTISLILVLVMCLAVFPFSAVAAEEEIDLDDLFKYDIELSDEQVATYLKKAFYDPDVKSNPYCYTFAVGCRVYDKYVYDRANGQYCVDPYTNGGFESLDELLDYFYELCGIKREYFEKYLIFHPQLFQYVTIENGKYYGVSYDIYVSPDITKIVNSYSSYDRAYFYAKLFYVLSGDFINDVMGYPPEEPGYEYYYLDESELRVPDSGSNDYITKLIDFDANFDGSVNARDLIILRKVMMGLDVKCNYYTKDLSGDGKTNAKDVLCLKKYVVTGVDMRNK